MTVCKKKHGDVTKKCCMNKYFEIRKHSVELKKNSEKKYLSWWQNESLPTRSMG